MTSTFVKAWKDVLRPMFIRPKMVQVAALCYRESGNGIEVLLVTSRGTGRWIIPKGWPINGLTGSGAALQEAWEEAGVVSSQINKRPVGTYEYSKETDEGLMLPVTTYVYLAKVSHLEDEYPECEERERVWVRPREAAEMVNEPELSALLKTL